MEGYPLDAILNYRRYLANKNSIEVKASLATLLYETNSDEESLSLALNLFKEVLKSTNSDVLRYNLAKTLYRLQSYEDCIKEFRKISTGVFENEGLFFYADALLKLGDFENSKEIFLKLYRENYRTLEVLKKLVYIFKKIDREQLNNLRKTLKRERPDLYKKIW